MGARLREMQIAQELGTSQTPVREAFRELAALGILETRSHTGTRVREVGARDLEDAVPVRAALEGLAGRLAAGHLAGRAHELAEALEFLEEAALSENRLALANASTQFHRAVVRGAENESLMRAWNALGIEVMTVVTLLSLQSPLSEIPGHHRPIYEAIQAGDADAAERILTSHVAHYEPTFASAAVDGR